MKPPLSLLTILCVIFVGMTVIAQNDLPKTELPARRDGHKIIYFLTWNNPDPNPTIHYAALYQNGAFLHAPDGNWTKAYPVSFVAVVNASDKKTFVRIKNGLFEIADDSNFASNVSGHNSFTYKDWDAQSHAVSVSDLTDIHN